jgi:hypothetical protein
MTHMTARAKLTIHQPGIQVKHHLWITWAEIAIAREDDAEASRRAAVAAHTAGRDAALDTAAETKAAMQAIAACAHAVDGLYGGVRPLIAVPASTTARWNTHSVARHARIRESLARGFRLRNDVAKRWKREFSWLFGLRNAEVHFEERFQQFVPHPVLPTHVAPEIALYSLESSTRAVDLLLDVFDHVLRPGSGRTALTEDYARSMDATTSRIVAAR